MLETFFLTVNEWIAGGTTIAALGCFVWGMVSVALSPCHLASIPLIVAYVGGQQGVLKPKEAAYYSVSFS
ncbi:MAG: cytochrome C biosynthesis protein, partial [Desulfobacteraceae bacterium]|nr:cytochrome C biosynthesis protein [Desulfobacteraceae bacterium]